MTREQAIECNKNLRMYMKLSDANNSCKFNEENYTALDLAIQALEQMKELNLLLIQDDAHLMSVHHIKEKLGLLEVKE